FVGGSSPSEAWARPRPTPGASLRVNEEGLGLAASARLFAWLNHWRARYEVVASGPTIASAAAGRGVVFSRREPEGARRLVKYVTGGCVLADPLHAAVYDRAAAAVLDGLGWIPADFVRAPSCSETDARSGLETGPGHVLA